MIGHLGTRVSALLDGQLGPADTEAAWAHVYSCHACRDLVEREGWIKSQLACLSGQRSVSDDLKGTLRNLTPGEQFAIAPVSDSRSGTARRTAAVVGSGAAGAAMLGVLAFGAAPASAPAPNPADRRAPSGFAVPTGSNTHQPVVRGWSPSQRPTPSDSSTSPSPTRD